MCGIVGIFAPQGEARDPRDAIAAAMSDCLSHRGPDGHGRWSDDNVTLAHRRLAIVELSPLGAQPMEAASGRYVITFNGEIYNFPELRAELMAAGHRFHGNSDTEVLLALIDQRGLSNALKVCVGMFAIALWDREERRLSLARDRFGEKPLYYGWCGKSLIFGSELKALYAHPAFDWTVSPDAVAEVVERGYAGPESTVYAAISQVPPGSILSWTTGTPARNHPQGEREDYWNSGQMLIDGHLQPFKGSLDDATDALQAALSTAIGLQLNADVPVGVFLSGGVDSSIVAALARAKAPSAVRSFSIGFDVEGFDEAAAARAVAGYLGTSHREEYVSEQDALAVLPEALGIYDEPFADASQIPTLLLARMARRHVTVALSGDGADEILGGYNRYAYGDRLWNARSRRLAGSAARGTNAAIRGVVHVASQLPGVRRFPWHSLSAATDLYSNDTREGFIQSLTLLNRQGARFVVGCQGRSKTAPDANTGISYRRAAMHQDLRSYLPGDILTKVDRATMSTSLESRAPFLDHRVVELCASFPDNYLFDENGGKVVAKKLLYRLVSRELVDRPKAGFVVPLGQWLRGDMRTWANDVIRSRGAAKVLDSDRTSLLLDQHCRGPFDLSARLWPLLAVAAWADRTYS